MTIASASTPLPTRGNVIASDASFADAVAHHQRGEREAAQRLYEQILTEAPAHRSARYNLAILLLEQSEFEAGLRHLDALVAAYPADAGLLYSRGRALAKLGRLDDALAALQAAAALDPANAEIQLALGNVFSERGERTDAAAAYRRVVALAGGSAAGHISLGRLLIEMANYREARDVLEHGLRIAPNNALLHFLLGQALLRLRQFEASKNELETAVRLAPDFVLARSHLMRAARFAGDWDTEERIFADIRSRLARVEELTEFLMPSPQALYFPFTRREQLKIAKAHARRVEQRVPFLPSLTGQRRAGPRLRVGYLSADFRDSATLHLAMDVLAAHDRSKLDVLFYSLGADDRSVWRRRAEAACETFVDLAPLGTRDCIARIADDRLDILIDLNVYTQFTRPEIPAAHPAPVQGHWLSVSGTSGGPWFDYVLADRTVVPESHLPDYTEACVWLPDCYQPNRRLSPPSAPPADRGQLGLPADTIVFCVFNSHRKLDRGTFESWLRILRGAERSVLWLLDAEPEKKQRLAAYASRAGVDPARLVYAPPLPHDAHLARFAAADVFLDSLIHGAHTTASDALRSGIPVLTVTGETFAARVATSLLRTAGLAGFAFGSIAEFEAAAIRLAAEPDRLAAAKREVAAKVPASPLFDPDAFARKLERAYQAMSRRFESGLPPQSFAVE